MCPTDKKRNQRVNCLPKLVSIKGRKGWHKNSIRCQSARHPLLRSFFSRGYASNSISAFHKNRQIISCCFQADSRKTFTHMQHSTSKVWGQIFLHWHYRSCCQVSLKQLCPKLAYSLFWRIASQKVSWIIYSIDILLVFVVVVVVFQWSHFFPL